MLEARLLPWQGPKVDQNLFAANAVLQLSTLELEQAIRQELDENPALEMVEHTKCPICGTPLRDGFCIQCTQGKTLDYMSSPQPEGPLLTASGHGDDEDVDVFEFVAAPLTLPEQLLAQLRLAVDESEYDIALHLVGNLDEHGYLTLSVEEVAQGLQVEEARVLAVLQELQRFDPAGIGARTVEECLLLQVERLSERGIVPPSSTCAIIQKHLEDLGHQHFEQIRTSLHLRRTEVEEVFLFVRNNLHPYPAHHYYAQVHSSPGERTLPLPSVLIQRSPTAPCGYEVEVVESRRFFLHVNPLYQRLKKNPELALSPGERKHVLQAIERARLFMSQLQRRSLLLQKVGTLLVEYQRDFLDQGPLYLHPLTQQEIADRVGVHVSTISRTVTGKFAQLPSRELVPLKRFFLAEQRTQELIRQIIAHETTPLSDERIAKQLSQLYAVSLSRQMVANYRAELGIPAARQRSLLRRS